MSVASRAAEGQIISCVPRSVFSYNSFVPAASRTAGVDTEPVIIITSYVVEKGNMFVLGASGSVPKNFLLTT